MSYAIRNDGQGWRAVNSAADVMAGETYFDVFPAPTSAQLLAAAQAVQFAVLRSAYQFSIAQPIKYISKAGVAKTYQSDPGSVANLQAALAGCSLATATPAGFYWVAADNTQVMFTYADLQGLSAAMFAQGFVAFVHLQTQKATVKSTTTVVAAQAVVW